MDPLSTSASIIALLQLSAKLVEYVNTAAGATKDRKRLREEVRACSNILQQLKDEADDSEEGKAWSQTIRILEGPDAPLRRLHMALDVVRIKLQPKDGFIKALKWPFQEKELQKIIEAIEREKSLLSLALENNSRKLLQEITKHSKENRRQLTELVELVKKSVQGNQSYVEELKDQLSRVQVLQTGTQDGVDRLHERQDSREASEERKAILDWLTPVNYASQQHDFINKRQAGTGQWLLDSEVYQAWLKAEKQTLLCPGIPGAGKTIFTSIVVDNICEQYREDPTVGVAYLYCNFRRHGEQRIDDITASLLKQLAEGQSPLSKSVKDLYDRHKKKRTRPSLEDILKALRSVATSYSRVFILVDALDECQAIDGCRTRFLSEIFALQEKCNNVNLLATSRSMPEILEKFEGSATLEIRASIEDVRKYLEGHMFRLPSFIGRNAELKGEIKTKIVQSVKGMFLLAQLHLDSLIGKTSPKAVRAVLEKLPTRSEAYDHAYKSAMERIEGQVADQEELAKQVLSWITCARRPLTTSELQHALGVEVGKLELDVENFPQVEDMVSVCAGLVTVDEESNIIRLVHYTTQEYFERTQKDWFPDAETMITRVCVTYLSFDAFSTGPCQTDVDFEDRLRTSKLYNYAAHNWGHHARVAPSACTEILVFLERVESVEASSQALLTRKNGWGSYSMYFPRNITGLHLAAYFGVEETATAILQQFVEVDVEDTYGRTPLSYAAERRHEAVVKLLLDNKAAVDSQDEDSQTPLLYAAQNGHEAVVELLLNNKAAVDSQDENGWTPLLYAAQKGYKAVVKLLLDSKAAVDSQDEIGQTPLSYAAEHGHEAVVELLLDNKAAVDSQDENGRTPLWYAAQKGYKAVVELLLNNKAVVDCQDKNSRTPLSYAAWNGHEAVVKLLLDSKAAVDSQDKNGRTPLSYAAWNGHEAVVKLLLNSKAAVDSQDENGRTPLWYAAQKGYKAVVELLLNNKAVVDSQDKNGQTPLSYAAQKGYEAVIELLLNNKAVVDSQDKNGRTPLSYAAWNGNKAVVKLLLDSKAAVDSQDKNGQTPLLYAAWNGHEAVVKLLLNKAAVDSQDENGRTPLSYAAWNGHEAVVELLLNNKAVVDSQDKNGQTPLSYAAQKGYEAVIELLLNNKAVVDCQDKNGRTPLSYAAWNGHEAVVKLLLDSKAAVDSQDENSRTPLWYAAQKGYEAVVELLLDKKAVVDSQDKNGRTPLSYAAWNGHEAVVKLLLDSKAAVDSQDENGRTPLWYAAQKGYEAVVELLLDKKAVVDCQDKNSRTPLSYAAWNGHEAVVKLLLDSKAAVGSQDENGRTPLWYAAQKGYEAVVELLLNNKAVVDCQDKNSRTPLSYAAWNGHEAVVKLLLDSKAAVDSQDENGRTPLWYAAQKGYEAVVELLLDKKASVDP